MKCVLLSLIAAFIITGCNDIKIKYVGYGDNECKYTTINGEFKTCELADDTYELSWVDKCIIPLNKDDETPSLSRCYDGNI